MEASHSLTPELTSDAETNGQDTRTTDTPTISEAQWERERQAFTQLVNLHQHPGCLDFCLKSIPITPWPHQTKILRRVAQQFPRSFLIADEVGLGKTIETGLILRYLLVSQKVKRVLILAPASVQPQWQEELREKFNLHFWSYAQGGLTDPYGNTVSTVSEGLNLQTCGVLVNYDMPWNPMRVEQRIGRLDRIGQIYPTVKIHNFYYDGTVEAKVYRKLRDRINAFATVVGNLQPILAQVPTFIEQAVMSADPQEEDVLMSEFEQVLNTPPLRPALEEMVAMDVEADLEDIRKPISPAPVTPEMIEQLFTTSTILRSCGALFERQSDHPKGGGEANRSWQLTYKGRNVSVTFYPEVFDEMPSLRLMSFGEPLFEELLENGITKTKN